MTNMIITCARNLEQDAKEEVRYILREFGDEEADVRITNMSGILTANTYLDPLQVIKYIREKIVDEPWSVRYSLKIVPIEEVVETEYNSISDALSKMTEKIKQDETYRISIKKRNSTISSNEIISKIAPQINRKVDLEHYDWNVVVEIMGGITGLSVIKDDNILSVVKTKRAMSE